MNDIVNKLYGGGEGGKEVKVPYYSSFQYQQDKKNGVGPPPASEGGPTAFEIYRHEGLVDEKGFMLSNPNVHMTTAALYGGGPQRITKNQSLNPNYMEGTSGNTVGGIQNDDGWGKDINWGSPISGKASEGQIFQTGAGDYKVIKNPWGQFELEPMEGAIKGAGHSMTNFASGGHHLGINPNTGQVWYQQALGVDAPYTKPAGANQAQSQQNTASRQGQQASRSAIPQNQAIQQAVAQRARQEGKGMLSGDNPKWSELSNTGMSVTGGMGPFMLGQLARRR